VKKEDPQKQFPLEWFYSDIFHNAIVDKVHEDEKLHWMLGISALVMSLTLTTMRAGFTLENLGFVIIFFSSLMAFLLSLFIFELPEFCRKIPHSYKSIMYYSSHKKMSADEFAEKLKKIRTQEDISDQYAYNVANLVNRNSHLKSVLVKWPVYILFFGIIIGVVCIVLFGGVGLIPAASAVHS